MKEMVKRVREEKGGFTLAELLIVVAILLVLIAIAVPVFSGALGNADEAVKSATQRSAKSEALSEYMLAGNTNQTVIYYAGYSDKGDELYFFSGDTGTKDATAKYKYKIEVKLNGEGENAKVQATVTEDGGEDGK